MIHVVAVITAKPGQRDLILEAYRANQPAVLAEKGWDRVRRDHRCGGHAGLARLLRRRHFRRDDGEVGNAGRPAGARRGAAHGGL